VIANEIIIHDVNLPENSKRLRNPFGTSILDGNWKQVYEKLPGKKICGGQLLLKTIIDFTR
jgi:hypothetical protein